MAAAPSLQRSMETFRRSGSSGLVWEDRFASGDASLPKDKDEGAESREALRGGVGTAAQMERSRSDGGGRPYLANRFSPAVDPPSPKVSGCGFCGIFRNSPTTSTAMKAKLRRR